MGLRKIDRCDQCNAPAVVLTLFVSGRLLFCGHHYDRHADELLRQAVEVLDYRLPGR